MVWRRFHEETPRQAPIVCTFTSVLFELRYTCKEHPTLGGVEMGWIEVLPVPGNLASRLIPERNRQFS